MKGPKITEGSWLNVKVQFRSKDLLSPIKVKKCPININPKNLAIPLSRTSQIITRLHFSPNPHKKITLQKIARPYPSTK